MHNWSAPRRASVGMFVFAAGAAFAQSNAATTPGGGRSESLLYSAEWRFVKAGEINLAWDDERQAQMALKSVGMVAALYTIDYRYRAKYDPGLCALALETDVHEGRRMREVRATFDRAKERAQYNEKDLVKNTVALSKEMDIPSCVHDVLGGLRKLRHMKLDPGQSAELPISDGKKVVTVRVEAQAKETIRTPVGQFPCIRYEAFVFNGVLYGRKGRLFVWISEDERRLPLRLKVQLPFYIGNVTVQLEKEEIK